jgi:folylpolyglutamate synthase
LIHVRERIRINGRPLTSNAFSTYFYECWDALDLSSKREQLDEYGRRERPTYFRFLTLMAFHAFLRERVDVAVVEVGIGGTYDSTNILPHPVVCGISAIGHDHHNVLGSTIEEIAWHKSGIMKRSVPVITAPQTSEVMEVFMGRAEELGARLEVAPALHDYTRQDPHDEIVLGLAGKHQQANAALSVALVSKWLRLQEGVDRGMQMGEDVRKALRETSWPGRCQTLTVDKWPGITWMFDGAHTVESMQACADWYSAQPQKGKKVLVFNCTGGRNSKPMLEILARNVFDEVIFCTNVTFNTQTFQPDLLDKRIETEHKLKDQQQYAKEFRDMQQAATVHVEASIQEAIERVTLNPDAVVLVTGSLHLVGGVMCVLNVQV